MSLLRKTARRRYRNATSVDATGSVARNQVGLAVAETEVDQGQDGGMPQLG